MRPVFATLALSLCLLAGGAAAAQDAAAPPETARIGRCRMGGCAWFQIYERQTVREVAGERLVRLRVREGNSEHPDNLYPARAEDAAIEWIEPADDLYFLCSARRPIVLFPQGGGGWEANPLDFVRGPFGPTEFTSAEYVAACHPGDDLNRPGFAARHGYRDMGEDGPAFSLARPEDIFAPRP